MFGSLGWGLAMFFVGIALDHSTAFSEHPCGPDAREKNYTICFAIFSVLMGAALITATQINFKYDVIASEPVSDRIEVQNHVEIYIRSNFFIGSDQTTCRTNQRRTTAEPIVSTVESS